MTTDALFLARLEKDVLRQTKSSSAHMDNNATGCYDRIIMSLGILACRRLDMPPNAIKCQTETLVRFLRYALKHASGISSTEYFSTIFKPLSSTGKGKVMLLMLSGLP
jgi:hypothetical protein